MGRLVYPHAREPIIPFCAAVSPTAECILGEQNGRYMRGRARVIRLPRGDGGG